VSRSDLARFNGILEARRCTPSLAPAAARPFANVHEDLARRTHKKAAFFHSGAECEEVITRCICGEKSRRHCGGTL